MALLWQEDGKPIISPSLGELADVRWRVSVTRPASPQDVADFEWVMWFTTFRNHILFALAGHVIFAKILALVAPKVCAKARKAVFERTSNSTGVSCSGTSESTCTSGTSGALGWTANSACVALSRHDLWSCTALLQGLTHY